MRERSCESLAVCCLVVAVMVAICRGTFAAPTIVCDEPVFRFGALEGTNAVEHVFVLRNRGDAPLVLGKARGCCGASVAITENAIAPGSNTTMKVTLDLGGRNGEVNKSLYVPSNDPVQPYLQIQLLGAVTPAVLVEPGFLDFGGTSSNGVVEREAIVTSLPSVPLRVTNVVSGGSTFHADVVAGTGKTCRIVVRTVPPLSQGVTHGTITAWTDNARFPRLEIPVLVTVASDIVVAPGSIALTTSNDPPRPVSRFFALRSRSGVSFNIIRIEPPDPGIESVASPLASGGWRCELRNILPFAELDGRQVVIVTDHPTCRTISIPIRIVAGAER